ncbi:MAG TPA: hypothetical protein VFU21_09160 [Kofleriaceae bacterium]|nr:hypothetical protein [Kofleriaceae bacterium]
MTRPALLLGLAAFLAGCRCGEGKKVEPAPAVIADAAPHAPATRSPPVIELEALPAETREAVLLERAYPAWGAVLERGGLLGRRGQRGAAYGRVAARGDDLWLLDETPSAPGLGIRVAGAGGARLDVSPGQRVLAFGAWEAEGKRWVWKVDRLVALAAGSGEAPALAVDPLPGKLVRRGAAPEGARTFWVVAAPVKAGDGWTIADAADGPPAATLLLPGEVLGAPYGGLDYLAPEERWTLARGKPYAAPMSEVQLRRKLPLPVLRASTPPVALAAQ